MPTEEQTYRQGVKDSLAVILKDVGEIKVQTKLTNGRVNKLENWKWALFGAWTVLTLVMIPLIAAYLQSFRH